MINFRTLRLLIPLAICSLCIQLNAQTDSVYDGTVHYFWTGDGNHVRYGLMDTAGNVICRPSFSQIGVPYFDLKSGPVPAAKGRKWGFINTKGEWVVRPMFEYAGYFHNGLAKVVVKDKIGYIRQDGTMAIEPQFEEGDHFFDTITVVGGIFPKQISKSIHKHLWENPLGREILLCMAISGWCCGRKHM